MEPWIVVTAILLVALAIGYANFQNARPFRIEASTILEPSRTLDTLQARLARDGWSLGMRDADSLVMNANRSADLGSTAAIGCFSAWLGLLYALSSRGTLTVEIHVEKIANGSLITVSGSRSGSVLRYIAARLHELPKS